MKNLININSQNIKTFGFTSVFDLANKNLRLDISGLTTFNTNGAAAVAGIYFSIVDPSGLVLLDDTQVAINPTLGNTVDVELSSFAAFGLFGITASIIDSDGQIFTIKIIKEICQPEGFVRGYVPAVNEIAADCRIPLITINDLTKYSYKGLTPESITKTGTLFYPKGTLADLQYTYTPYSVGGSGQVYTGRYTLNQSAIATYDLGDGVYLNVTYENTGYEKIVTCTSVLTNIICCINDTYEKFENDPYGSNGRDAKSRLDQIQTPFMLAVIKEMAGQDASELAQEISDKLNCDCGCNENSPIEQKAILTGGTQIGSISVTGVAAAVVTPVSSGGNIQYEVKVKNINVLNLNNDLGFTINKTVADNVITFAISFNYDVLAQNILNEIAGSADLTNMLLDIVRDAQLGIDLSGLDGGCVLTIGNCTYNLIEAHLNGKTISGITIGGTLYEAPTGLSAISDTLIQQWLNSLQKGAFTAVYDSVAGTIHIESDQNPNSISTITFVANGAALIRQFSKTCVQLKQVLQAIINYTCGLSMAKVVLGEQVTLCALNDKGVATSSVLSDDSTLQDLIDQIVQTQCSLVNALAKYASLDCTFISSIFTQMAEDEKIDWTADLVLGKVNGSCRVINFSDLASAILSRINSSSDLKTQFCNVVNTCNVPVCDAPTNVKATLDNGDSCTPVTDITGSAQ